MSWLCSFVYCYWKDGGTFGILFSTLNTKQTGRNNMITRKELAKAAKRTLKKHFWILVVVCLIAENFGNIIISC